MSSKLLLCHTTLRLYLPICWGAVLLRLVRVAVVVVVVAKLAVVVVAPSR